MNGTIDQTLETVVKPTIRTIRDQDDVLDLRYGVYYAGTGDPEKYVFFSNGRAEWLEKYSYLHDDLGLSPKTALVSWDHRGQGLSGGTQAWIDSYDTYAQDAARVIAAVSGGKPFVVVAHSMGALIALYATLQGAITPQALVLGSPLLGMPNRPVPRPLAKPLSGLLVKCGLGTVSTGAGSFTEPNFERNPLTHSRERYTRIKATEHKIPGATFEWVAATFAAIDLVFDVKLLQDLTCPTLVLGGTGEAVVDKNAFAKWANEAQRQAPAPVRLVLVPDAKHELFSEIPAYYQVALRETKSWLQEYF